MYNSDKVKTYGYQIYCNFYDNISVTKSNRMQDNFQKKLHFSGILPNGLLVDNIHILKN